MSCKTHHFGWLKFRKTMKKRLDMNDKYDILDVVAVTEIATVVYLALKFMGV